MSNPNTEKPPAYFTHIAKQQNQSNYRLFHFKMEPESINMLSFIYIHPHFDDVPASHSSKQSELYILNYETILFKERSGGPNIFCTLTKNLHQILEFSAQLEPNNMDK